MKITNMEMQLLIALLEDLAPKKRPAILQLVEKLQGSSDIAGDGKYWRNRYNEECSAHNTCKLDLDNERRESFRLNCQVVALKETLANMPNQEVNESEKELIRDNRFIQAIKEYRERTGFGLKRCKEVIDLARDEINGKPGVERATH